MGESLVDDGVERGVADEVVGNVDLEPLVLRDGRGQGVDEIREGWNCTLLQFLSCLALVLPHSTSACM